MICPKCHRDALYVIDTRNSRTPPGLKRRRTCAYCHGRFVTYEITQEKLANLTNRANKNMRKEQKENDLYRTEGKMH